MRVVGIEPEEPEAGLPDLYWQACRLAAEGQYDEAVRLYGELETSNHAAETGAGLRALIQNDLAAIAAVRGRFEGARQGWRSALEADADCLPARLNRDLVAARLSSELPGDHALQGGHGAGAGRGSLMARAGMPVWSEPPGTPPSQGGELCWGDLSGGSQGGDLSGALQGRDGAGRDASLVPKAPVRVAVLSFLFNWPSTGGGNMHTAGLVDFLARAGYEVRHFYASYTPWGIGRVEPGELPASEAIEFDGASWTVAEIQARFLRAVDRFNPDYVAITDTWNMKPLLAEAVSGYPRLLLFQAQECICPLNNIRLLADGPDHVEQCPRNQLATPELCRRCVAERGRQAGALHQVERALAGAGTPAYDHKLRQALQEAEAVLVLNPLTAELLEPFCSRVRIVPWGLDPARFPCPPPDEPREPAASRVLTLFMAAVRGEFIKGFHIAHQACRLLREKRSDFELVVTFDPPGRIDAFTRSIGWQSQAELPRSYRAADICLVPTIAQDGLSITSVEAMASGIPVIGSRIGGVPYTVSDGLTGLLFEPGDASHLARKIETLLDDAGLRRQMGLAGRKRFEEDFTWETVIDRHWRPLLSGHAEQTGRAGADSQVKAGRRPALFCQAPSGRGDKIVTPEGAAR
jgi:glycosyltransferase involved in cell wall biosynthesis